MDETTDAATRITEVAGRKPDALVELEGGAIGSVFRVEFPGDGRPLVAKVGDTPLSVEGYMLRYLDAHTELPVPTVYYASDDLLLLEHVAADDPITPAVERDAADHLAALHDVTAAGFGFERDTLHGPLRLPNPWTDSWIAFWRDHRLLHAADAAGRRSALSEGLHDRVLAVAADLDDLLVEPSAPALVHGDVWTGNVLARGGRVAAFLDPAIYYGHPAVDLAYVRWADTFGEPFFERYREHRPIADGFVAGRWRVYALYPQLAHVDVFGEEFLDPLAENLSELGY